MGLDVCAILQAHGALKWVGGWVGWDESSLLGMESFTGCGKIWLFCFVSEGIDFLAPHVGLKSSSCFVAMEAVDWAMEKIGGVKTRRDATSIFQVRG